MGIEKESLRVLSDGQLSQGPHPRALGSALTNKFITTDFSESLLEFVTPACGSSREALRYLCEIHQYVYERIDNELLWVNSMPCLMSSDDNILLAQFGSSNVGKMKTVYRNGLAHRYGKRMQTISGIHFNYSTPSGFWRLLHRLDGGSLSFDEFRSAGYMSLVRNFRRCGWLILYLFGSSPALCKSFFAATDESPSLPDLEEFDKHTFYAPFATSLRMSDLGYSNSTQAGLNVSLNSLSEYIHDLNCAICTPEPSYQEIGVKVDGEYRQLSANKLQIENEYYSSVRPKRVAQSGERPTAALLRGGVEYVEIRSLDLNMFDPVGINQNTMRFVEVLLLYCALSPSPRLDDSGLAEVARNHDLTAKSGRDPELQLFRDGSKVSLRQWAGEMIDDISAIAELVDNELGGSDYQAAVDTQRALVIDAEQTPSARILQDMRENKAGFFDYAMQSALQHRDYFAALAVLDDDRQSFYDDETRESLERQSAIEAADNMSFDDYLAKYFSEQGCC